jgi:hypothetical protein
MVRIAIDNSMKLSAIPKPVNTLGHRRVNPSVYFKLIAQPVSARSARKRKAKTSGHRWQRSACVLCISASTLARGLDKLEHERPVEILAYRVEHPSE